MQVLDAEARIFLFHNFLTDAECDHIIGLAKPKMERSGVVDTKTGNSDISDIRTSSGTFLERGQDDVVAGIEERIARWTLLPVGNGEGLQVLRYTKGQEYQAHWDYFFDEKNTANGGNRYATVLMYLNDVEEGGETAGGDNGPEFSDCARKHLAAKPKKGAAVLFHSIKTTGELEKRSLHTACPVIKGYKWSAPKWIHVGHYAVGNEQPVAVKQHIQKAGGPTGPCEDKDTNCDAWAAAGECEKNPVFMVGNRAVPGSCVKACGMHASCTDGTAQPAANGNDQPAANGSSGLNSKDARTDVAAPAAAPAAASSGRDSSFERKLRRAKRAARSELSVSKGEWRKWGYASAPGLLETAHLTDGLERVDGSTLTLEQFVQRYEAPRRPVMLTGLCGGWRAAQEWTPDRLLERLGDCKFKVGSDDDGYAVRLKLKHFMAYCSHPEHAPADDSPLYVFAHLDREREEGKALLRDYEVPTLFAEDLMRLAGERRRPPYRWFVCGPARSGTNMHVDPLATSAWNALLRGHKRWVLFPPGTPNALIKPKGVE
ncbi:hypothetical protein COHA_010678, partial [Chlorella ohadii]